MSSVVSKNRNVEPQNQKITKLKSDDDDINVKKSCKC